MLMFVQVVSSGAKALAAGTQYSMMLKQDGSVWTTGGTLTPGPDPNPDPNPDPL